MVLETINFDVPVKVYWDNESYRGSIEADNQIGSTCS
jgi:hypothetical protein